MSKLKLCKDCKKIKSIDLFPKAKNSKSGVRSYCRICYLKILRQRSRTKIGHIRKMYYNQKHQLRLRKIVPPNYTINELIEWCIKQEIYHDLHLIWEKSGYNKWKAPSCDRINDYIGYSLNNLQLMSWDDNYKKYQIDRISGKNNKTSKKIAQFEKNGSFIRKFHSIHSAGRVTGISFGNISSCANDKMKSAGGYIWKFI